MRRKLLLYTASLLAGILFAYIVFPIARGFCCGFGGIYVVCKLWHRRRPDNMTLLVFFCVLGMVLFSLHQWNYTHGYLHEQSLQPSDKVTLQGRVMAITSKNEASHQLTVLTHGERLLCHYYQSLEKPWTLLGYQIAFSGEIEEPDSAGNPRCFDYRLYLRSKGIGYQTTINHFVIKSQDQRIFHRVQVLILEKKEGYLSSLRIPKSAEGILRGILFGDTTQMDEETYEAFRMNGTAHVLAVSGLHVGMLYSVYRWLEEKLHQEWVTVLFFILLLVYGTATLWSVSVTRAIMLILLVLLGKQFHCRYDILTALAAIAMFILIRNPYAIFGASFQMSFLAVLSISFLQDPMERVVGKGLSASAAVQVGLMPYMAYVFNQITLIGIFCNIPIVFLVSLLVPLGMAAFLFYGCLDTTIPIISDILEGMTELIVWVNQWFTVDGRFSLDMVSPPIWVMVLCYGVIFGCTSERVKVQFCRDGWKGMGKPLMAFLVAVLVAVPLGRSPFDDASLVFVDVGQGDCIHFQDRQGRHILIDGGGNINYDVGEKVLKPYLLKNGISCVDLAAATHLHTDHYLGLEQLASCFDVKSLLKEGKAGDRIALNETQWIEILWPVNYDVEVEDENLNSLIFMIHDQGVKTLVTGDITAEGEAMLREFYRGTDKLRADILKVAHHGSAYSSSDGFLDVVNPKIAVICVGQNNYGHPAEIVVEKLVKRGIIVFRTDLDGAVGMTNRKGMISVCTKKQR